jgi:predicted nucleic acid-binding protein
MDLLADANWLIRLEKELNRGVLGPATRLYKSQRIHVNTMAHTEFLSAGQTPRRVRIVKSLVRLPPSSYQEALTAAKLRYAQQRRGKTLGTPDAYMAASALHHHCRLLTADKDFSGIPGLDWSAYRS